MPNRLINETSPYLVQHANNPVDWFPWGDEALAKAREEDKPILLSIGYSACHWCHVMERESFENDAIAHQMNENFVNIKVDREERPDLDSIYMQAVQALTGQGGWPMTVFLTPDCEPFFGGTYYPPEDRGGMPGFPRVLEGISQAYQTRREDVAKAGSQLTSRLRQFGGVKSSTQLLTEETLTEAALQLEGAFDPQNGGFGGAPKFPQPMIYDFLLHYYHASKSPRAMEMVDFSLERMARGGMYDQLGGGFHRYATDAYWLVPHFEKMLYDNALLSRLYLHAYLVTGRQEYQHIVEETLDYVLREMTNAEGGFYSSQDADSEGVEGKIFVWSPDQIVEALGEEDAELFCAYYGVTDAGNFEGSNILNVPQAAEVVAREAGVTAERLMASVRRGKETLLGVRSKRIAPDRDDKVLTAWNGLMLRSFAEAAAVLQREDYRAAAETNARFLVEKLRADGRVLRTYKDGRAKLNGYLEDYSFLADGLLGVYELTLDQCWLDEAKALADGMVGLFWVEEEGVFFDTGKDHEALLVRPRELFDNAIPCGSSVAVEVLLKLSLLTGEEEYRSIGSRALHSVGPLLGQHPLGMSRWLCGLDFYIHRPKEIAVVGGRTEEATQALLREVHGRYLPNKVLAATEEEDVTGTHELPLLRFRTLVRGQPAAYVCEDYVCQLPVTEPSELAQQLET